MPPNFPLKNFFPAAAAAAAPAFPPTAAKASSMTTSCPSAGMGWPRYIWMKNWLSWTFKYFRGKFTNVGISLRMKKSEPCILRGIVNLCELLSYRRKYFKILHLPNNEVRKSRYNEVYHLKKYCWLSFQCEIVSDWIWSNIEKLY